MSEVGSTLPSDGRKASVLRGALQVIGGVIPIAGGLVSAAAGAWSESEQNRINRFFEQWIEMLEDELREKEKTVIDIMSRLDLHDEKIAQRIESKEFQSIMRKTFRDWAAVESEEKRILIRNVLSNAATCSLTSDDVVRLFIEWVSKYSELHHKVIGLIYKNPGITRGELWSALGKEPVREDSADADLFKLLVRDLSTGGVSRQIRERDQYGNFLTKRNTTSANRGKFGGQRTIKSAFDDSEGYELTSLGEQFVHYAMTDLPIKLEFKQDETIIT
jgi:hypothetical protein